MNADGSTLTTPIDASDIDTRVDREPRLRDHRLAEDLGFSSVSDFREFLEPHVAALERLGALAKVFEETSGRRSRPRWGWALNRRQALYVCAAADTPAAAEVAVRVLDAFESAAEIEPEEPMEGQTVPASELLHPALLLRIERRARKLCEESVPRLRAELIRDVVHDLAAARPLDIENAVFQVSTLRRFRPGSEEEATHLIGQWAWEIVPDTKNVELRERIREALTELLRGNGKPPVP